MPVLAAVIILIQFLFAYHVLKTGRPYWWVFIIFAAPIMGSLIYYFVEVFPNSSEHRKAHKTARKIAQALNPDADLKRRAEELEICGSVDNRIALAEECMRHQMYPEAIKLLESCLTGAFAADGNILLALARAYVEGQHWEKAKSAVHKAQEAAPNQRPQDASLLEARILEGQGEHDAAISAYRKLIPSFVGLEARYRYGCLLSKIGHHSAATQVFDEVIMHSKRFASSLEDEQRWASAARQAIAG
ncbi:MAG: tetratricopeptide repeat protein [Betaproteobacteria bacterium]|nr:tetratricopeptide repeat protein [Betaproteobacteria bacterium]